MIGTMATLAVDAVGLLAQTTNGGTEIEDWEDIPWWAIAAAGAFAVGMWVFLFIQVRRAWRLKDVPISHTVGAFVGVGRFEGVLGSERPLVAPFVGAHCVCCRAEVYRKVDKGAREVFWKSRGRFPFRSPTTTGRCGWSLTAPTSTGASRPATTARSRRRRAPRREERCAPPRRVSLRAG